jgi:hypothetical protein
MYTLPSHHRDETETNGLIRGPIDPPIVPLFHSTARRIHCTDPVISIDISIAPLIVFRPVEMPWISIDSHLGSSAWNQREEGMNIRRESSDTTDEPLNMHASSQGSTMVKACMSRTNKVQAIV